MTWKKRIGRIVLLLLLAELLFFFVLATRIRKQLEGPREYLGVLGSPAAAGSLASSPRESAAPSHATRARA